MTESISFRTVMRGYEPAEVHKVVADLNLAVAQARADARRQQEAAQALRAQVSEMESRAEEQPESDAADEAPEGGSAAQGGSAPEATFEHLGERIGAILGLARDEAAELRTRAQGDVDNQLRGVREEADRLRADADAYAQERRGTADSAAAQMLQDTQRTADTLVQEAEHEAAARREEGEALFEQHRAAAAAAVADGERGLAERRRRADAEFAERAAAAEQLEAEAQARADAVQQEAEKRAAVVREQIERETAAASRVRDDVLKQLASVQQMLSMLSGAAGAPHHEANGDQGPVAGGQAQTGERVDGGSRA